MGRWLVCWETYPTKHMSNIEGHKLTDKTYAGTVRGLEDSSVPVKTWPRPVTSLPVPMISAPAAKRQWPAMANGRRRRLKILCPASRKIPSFSPGRAAANFRARAFQLFRTRASGCVPPTVRIESRMAASDWAAAVASPRPCARPREMIWSCMVASAPFQADLERGKEADSGVGEGGWEGPGAALLTEAPSTSAST